jgi:hypothetical protein
VLTYIGDRAIFGNIGYLSEAHLTINSGCVVGKEIFGNANEYNNHSTLILTTN